MSDTTPRTLHPSPRRHLAGLRTISALILREMATTYGRSPGGYLWAVLEPVAGIALLSLVFSIGFHAPALGVSFPMFYATGMIPFVFFTDVTGKLAQAINFSRALLAYPSVTFLDAIIARFILNAATQVMVGYVVLAGLLVSFDTRTVLDPHAIMQSYAMLAILSFGVGTMNCFLMTQFQVWQRIWSVVMRPMFIVSCIFFLFETIPQPYRDYLWFNPLVHVIGTMRRGFYPTYDASYVSPAYVIGLGLALCVIGLLFLRRYHRALIDR